MKKILVFVDSFTFGGITSLIQDIYRSLDRTRYQISFLRTNGVIEAFDKEVTENGDKVYYIENEGLGKTPVLNYAIRSRHMIKKVCDVVGDDKYDVAYIHANAAYAVHAAKKLKIPNIIMHVHEALSDFNGNEKNSKITSILWNRRVKMYNRLVDHKLGDSAKACVTKFGKQVLNDPKMMVVNPPINMEKFNPDSYSESDLPQGIIPDIESFNIIHVGRLCAVKNQKFLIDILSELSKTKKSHLYIVGEGDKEKEKLIRHAQDKGVLDYVTFLAGNTSPAIYKYMNCSILPSFSEAFGMVAVESQLMGVPCFASTNVPSDVDVGMCTFTDLQKGANTWAEIILGYDYVGKKADKDLINQFDIDYIIKKLESIF